MEVQIGGEVFHNTCTISRMEYKNHPRATEAIKRELIGRFLDELREQLYEQIGRF